MFDSADAQGKNACICRFNCLFNLRKPENFH
jgi:hypothetical protein